MSGRLRIGFWMAAAWACAAAGEGAPARRAEVVFYAYHDKVPYCVRETTDAGETYSGIYADLVRYLNERQDACRIRLEHLPRVRLERELELDTLDGAVVGVHPVWFRDADQTRFLWTSPFMRDEDVVVVRRGQAFAYAHPRDLAGRRLSLPRGLYFWGVTEMARDGELDVEFTDREVQNLQKVALGRADATITSVLTLAQLGAEHSLGAQLERLPEPHDRYDRRLLIPHRLANIHAILAPLLEKAMEDETWLDMLGRYGYSERDEP